MKPHTHDRALAVVYTALTLAGLLWNHLPVEPYDPQPAEPQTLGNPIHDAQPMPAPAPAPQPHRDRVTYDARN